MCRREGLWKFKDCKEDIYHPQGPEREGSRSELCGCQHRGPLNTSVNTDSLLGFHKRDSFSKVTFSI